jgi:hypothetical protein
MGHGPEQNRILDSCMPRKLHRSRARRRKWWWFRRWRGRRVVFVWSKLRYDRRGGYFQWRQRRIRNAIARGYPTE